VSSIAQALVRTTCVLSEGESFVCVKISDRSRTVLFFRGIMHEAILVIKAIAPNRVAVVYFTVVNKSMGFSLTFSLGKQVSGIDCPSDVSPSGHFPRTLTLPGDTRA
jgi:hypothetical protein